MRPEVEIFVAGCLWLTRELCASNMKWQILNKKEGHLISPEEIDSAIYANKPITLLSTSLARSLTRALFFIIKILPWGASDDNMNLSIPRERADPAKRREGERVFHPFSF